MTRTRTVDAAEAISQPEGDLLAALHLLDAQRNVLEQTKAEIAATEQHAIDLMRRLRISAYQFGRNRTARLVRDQRASIEVDAFLDCCAARGIGTDESYAALRRTVNLAAARKLLGAGADNIATVRQGDWHIRVVSAR